MKTLLIFLILLININNAFSHSSHIKSLSRIEMEVFRNGKLIGTITGFCIGLISNLFGVGSLFGLEPLSLSIVGYSAGYLSNSYEKLLPYIFRSIWLIIIFLYFFIICYFRFQNIYLIDISNFLFNWLASVFYTLLFIISIQFIYPLKDASHAKVS